MTQDDIGNFTVSQQFSEKFAEASGDFNPLHIDPVRARRYQFGSTVAHGVCGTMKALDIFTSRFSHQAAIESLKVQFNKPIRHGEKIGIKGSQLSPEAIRIKTLIDETTTQIIDVVFSAATNQQFFVKQSHNHIPVEEICSDLTFNQAIEASGDIDLAWNDEYVVELFPNLKEKLPDHQLAILLGLTKIVGMKCPGLNSIFGQFSLKFDNNSTNFCQTLSYKVISADERFKRIIISASNNLAQAEIEAFLRPPPVQQANYVSIKKFVEKNQFANCNALIIGGSRGLGEITCKLIAAGGGHPIITYSKGKQDAEQVANEINREGGICEIRHYDVLSPDNTIANCFKEEKVTHIYYFASPIIEKSDNQIWSERIFSQQCDFYLSGLAKLLQTFSHSTEYRRSSITIFIPSTVFIDEPEENFSEYMAAKASAEILADQIQKRHPHWHIRMPRLPRLMTDQTSGAIHNNSTNTAEVIMRYIS